MDPEAGAQAGATAQRRAFSRVPLRAKARMEFAEQRCFLSEWAVNLSPGGMFVRSEAPMTAGQRFHFEASLTPKGPRFEGVGEVMWVRTTWEGNARPPGFAVRFLELEDDGRAMMVRLAAIFLERGVGAMQEELQALSAAWQRRRLDDESTDEIQPLVGELAEPLPDTAVIEAPWAAGFADELDAVKGERATSAGAVTEPPSGELTVNPPLAVEPVAESPVPDKPAAAGQVGQKPAPGRRRVWWVGMLALVLLGGSGYLVARGPLVPRALPAGGVAETTAMALPAMPPVVPAAAPAPARTLERPVAFAGLDDVRCEPDGDALWVVLTLDGELPAEALHSMRPQDPPREVIQLLGARRGYAPALIPVGSPLLAQIRVGFHPDGFHPDGPADVEGGAAAGAPPAEGGELRVVLDLTSPMVVAGPAIHEGRSVRVRLTRGAAASPEPPPAAAPPVARPETSPARPSDVSPATASQ